VGEARTPIGVLTAVVAIVAGGALANGAEASLSRQFGSFKYTNVHPNKPTATVADFIFRNPENANQKPHSVAKMVVRSPAAALIDTVHFPQCHASDQQLMAEGFDGCPADTQIGYGYVVSDSGGGGSTRYSTTEIRDYNGDHEVIGVGVNQVPAIRSVDHTKLHGRESTTVFPTFPGFPPPDSYTPIQHLHIVFPRRVRNGHAYARTPPKCPESRRWTIKATFTYHDGVAQTLKSRSRCKQR
jgi:hypothetical protein